MTRTREGLEQGIPYDQLDEETHLALFGVSQGDPSLDAVYRQQSYSYVKSGAIELVTVFNDGVGHSVFATLPAGFGVTGGGFVVYIPGVVAASWIIPNGWMIETNDNKTQVQVLARGIRATA